MFWDHVYRNRHIMQEFEDIEVHKTSVSVFVALFYLEMLYILIMTLSILNRLNQNITSGYLKMIIRPSRLYLLKDEKKQDIYVDFQRPLHQHQVDGIRLLYKLYKKKKPGVILNDPSGYGKCVQTVLFINAILPILDNKPVFILCNENDVENWKEHFNKWTNCYDDVAIESTNPFSKKLIYINTVKDAYTFCRRQWSIVIIHDNKFTKDTLHAVFKADFKIWVTSVDMKKNLQIFSLLYQWLYPNDNFKINEFISKKKDHNDILHKSLLLNAFLEDIVIRRDDFDAPFNKPENRQPIILESPPKRSRKNKDPTGLKVKRSKKQIIHDNNDDEPVENTTTNHTTSVSASDWITNDVNTDDLFNFTKAADEPRNDEMDIENFIRDEKPIESNVFKDYTSDENTEEYKIEESNTSNDFRIAIDEIVKIENKVQENVSENNVNSDLVNTLTENIPVKNTETQYSNSYSISKETNVNVKEENFNKGNICIEESDVNISCVEEDNTNYVLKETERDSSIKSYTKISNNVEEKTNFKNENKINSENAEVKDESGGHKDIFMKLAKLEAEAMKKFKGSLLDSIF